MNNRIIRFKSFLFFLLILTISSCTQQVEFPLVKERIPQECGPASLAMIAQYYGKKVTLDEVVSLSEMDKSTGTSLENLNQAAVQLQFQTLAAKINYNALLTKAPKPCIVHWEGNYFAVVYKMQENKVFLAHPREGLVVFEKNDFIKYWLVGAEGEEGVVLAMEPITANQ